MTRGPGLSLAADGTSRAALARNRGPGTGHAEYTFLGRCICAHSPKSGEWEEQKPPQKPSREEYKQTSQTTKNK